MKRGDICVVAGGSDYSGKPRPIIVLQDDGFDATESVTVCPLTSHEVDAPLVRLAVEPTSRNGLQFRSYMMVDKIITVPRRKVGRVIGRLAGADQVELNRAVAAFLGLATPIRSEGEAEK